MSSEPGDAVPGRAAASDVAIIGMAARLPEADDVQQFLENLRRGRDSVRELSVERRVRTSLPLDEDYQVSGYIEDIDSFDPAFFGLSRSEAQNMAPQHRLLLQVVHQAIENAGYDPGSLRGLRASVYVGATRLEYARLARTIEPTMVMGSHVAAMAGRISRFFGLRGPCAMVDSSCSSALLAVHLAVNDLLLGEAELALASGVNLNLFGDPRSGDLDLGIRSADGRTRCFSADADGTGSGEAVATLVLKRLDRALRDGDPVQAVIKGIAANNVAGRSSTLTAPDSASEAEVIERAWEKARIDPTTISYIEAHGTATRLGDPIEIEAVDQAFGRVTSRKRFCALSSVKSNIGHTWSAAGIVGLIKAVLALRHGVLFPSLHAANLSPLIDFANSAVVVTRELTPWEPACGVRRAGVSSFGVMGTNVHAVLEEAPRRRDAAVGGESPAGGCWIPVSAKSAAALESNIAALERWVEGHPEARLEDIQRTLVGGRGHYPHRFCVTAASLAELSAVLARPASPRMAGGDTGAANRVTVLLVSGRRSTSAELTGALRRDHPHFDRLYRLCESAAVGVDGGARANSFAFQYAFYGLLRHIGLRFHHVVAEGAGRHVIDASSGRVPLDEALRRAFLDADAGADAGADLADLDARLDRLMARLTGEGRLLFVEAGPMSRVSRALAERGGPAHGLVAAGDKADGFVTFLRDLYLSGASWRWDATAGGGSRIELPSYQFERIRCWLQDVDVPARVEVPVDAGSGRRSTAAADALTGVCEVWKDVLGLEALDPEASFFELGGDSISALQTINRIQALFGVELEEFAILDHQTPHALARHVAESMRAAPSTAQAVAAPGPEQPPFAASPAQLHVWLASQFEGGSVAFNLTRSVRLTGKVDTGALRRAVDALVERHDALRTAFSFAGGELTQRVEPNDRFTVPLEERSIDESLPGEPRTTALIREFAGRPFDLERGPLLRVQLLSFRKHQHLMTLSTHHIVADGWSLDLLLRDLAAFYASFSRGTPLQLPPMDVTHREHHLDHGARPAASREAAAAYWLGRFQEAPPVIDLPLRSGVGGAAFSGSYRDYVIPAPLWERLRGFSRGEGATVFASLLSAFAALFSRYSDGGELVLGTSVAGRSRKSSEQLVGMLVRTVPLRLHVHADSSFRGLLDHVRSTFGDALRHLDYSYEELVSELQRRGLLRSPHLFDVLIEFEQFAQSGPSPIETMAGPDLQVAPVDVTLETSVFPLNIMLAEQDGALQAAIRFDTRLFDDHAIDQLWEAFLALLEATLDRATAPLKGLPLLAAAEQRRMRMLGHRTLEFDGSSQIRHAIERFAALTPDRVSLRQSGVERTFGQLNARANQLARCFADRLGVGPGEVVALIADRSILMVESILALWKCGAAYLPVDPGHPPSYVRTMLESSGVRVVAVDPSHVSSELTAALAGDRRVVELTAGFASAESPSDLGVPTPESALAYVIYTSGSTGPPKGVMVEHRGMLNHLHAKIVDLSLSERSAVVQNASNSFDISVWQMFAGPFAGGRTVIYEKALQLEPLPFAARLDADGATVLEVVPSYLETLLDAWERSDRSIALASLEFLVVTGEAVHPRVVNRWLRLFPRVPVVNAYGPTEASDDITHHVMTSAVRTDTVPLGRPIPNMLVYVLDEHLRLCPKGVKGEIFASGIGVSRGYLHAPAQTALAFVPDPFDPARRMYRTGDCGRWTADGTLEYLGRTDSQVKVRGFRIDLGEVERRVSECPGVKAAAVVTRPGAGDQLCAYVVLEPGGSRSRCRAHLSRELPHYMVPADFVEIDQLPLTANGKIDRKALERLDGPQDRSAPRQTASETERTLARIWEQVLDREGIGVTDRFFDVGGNSLRAMQVLSRVRSQLGVELGLETMFAQPTIADLAGLVSKADPRAAEPIRSTGAPGAYDIAPSQHLLLHIERTSPQRDAFNRNDLYELRGQVDPARLERSFALLVERHESLRTTFETVGGKPVQVVHEPGALALPFDVHHLAHDDPLAVRRLVERRIREPFEIDRQPLVRADLLRTGAEACSLLVSMHQLVSDGRSAEVLVRDWTALYDALSGGDGSSLPPLAFQYKDAARWRRDRMTQERQLEHREFWSRELEGASSIVPLRTDRRRPPVAALTGARLRLPIGRALTERIAELASRHEVTEFVVARCAVALLLLAETGLTDVTIGTYTRGRNRVDLEDQIGFYINTVPLRLRLLPDDDVPCLLRRAQREVLRAFQHEEHPYEWTMRELGWARGPERSPLFDVMVAMDEMGGRTGVEAGRPRRLELEPLELPRRSKEGDLLFAFWRWADRLEIAVTYDTELFTPDRVRRFATGLRGTLEALVDERPIAEILKTVAAAT